MNRLLFTFLVLSCFTSVSQASESLLEKLENAARSEARQMEKGSHRMQELLCMEGTLKCTAKKAANRAKEVGAAIGDGAVDIKNQIDE